MLYFLPATLSYGGATYTQTLTTSTSTSATMARSLVRARTIPASCTIAVLRSRVLALSRAAGSGLSPVLVRAAQHLRDLSASATAGASLAQTKVKVQSIIAVVTSSGLAMRGIALVRGAAITVSASRSRAVRLQRAASIAAVGTLVRLKATAKVLAAGSAVSATLSRVRALRRTVAAVVAATASRSRLLRLVRSASVAPVGSLVRARTLRHALFASVGVSGAVARALALRLSAVAHVAATRVRVISRIRSMAVIADASLHRSIRIIRSAVAAPVASLVEMRLRVPVDLSAVVTTIAAATRLRALKHALAAVTTISASRSRSVGRTLRTRGTIAARILRGIPVELVAVQAVAGAVFRGWFRQAQAAVTAIGSLAQAIPVIGRVMADVLIRAVVGGRDVTFKAAVGGAKWIRAAVRGKPGVRDE